MTKGFYKRRRGILEHIEARVVDLLEAGIHDYLNLRANLLIGSPCSIPPGICFTSAPEIHRHCRRVSERTIQRCLEHLEEIGWLKTWKVPGKRGNYPTLICRGSVHDLSGNEYRINGEKTTDWRHPVYEPVGEVSGNVLNPVATLSGDREKRLKKRENKKPLSAASPQGSALATLLCQRILENNPGAKITDSQPGEWGREADLMLRRDGRSEASIRELIEWSQRDSFWKGNILSMGNLRKHFDRMTIKKNEKSGGTTNADQRTAERLKIAGLIQ